MDKITQQKIKEAKQLLEQYAPKGEFLAYINKKEARILKAYGGVGKPIKQTNIPSYLEPFTMFAIAIGVQTGLSFLGNLQNVKNMKNARLADKRIEKMRAMQENIQAAKRAKLFMSEKRARLGARGVEDTTGSPVAELNMVMEEYEDSKFYTSLGLQARMERLDLESRINTGNAQRKGFEDLLSGAYGAYSAYKKG